ncbi:tyrosine-type recombinase/integrase [Streptomyces murinus]|uniref:tyrosine-type recombinase/integrase n=1 Tax=Streptomyces murinus TaxID=33900 RepID=UPI0036E31C48
MTDLDLGGHRIAHQARHTLATRLLRAGASLTHSRRYLGQVSDRMAEHYVHLTQLTWKTSSSVSGPPDLAPPSR